jgi:catechol 2,3-dioxygenase-like lactoylglutathione lyase family enzyme
MVSRHVPVHSVLEIPQDKLAAVPAAFSRGKMISAAHVVIYSKNAEADRAFFRDVLGFKSVDAGHGWLVFALPPGEAAFHPSDKNGAHELYFICDDLKAEMASLAKKDVKCSEVQQARWGSITKMRLPGGGAVGLYQPKHPLAIGLK